MTTATEKKNIAIIIDSLAGGGAEKVMLTLASELVAQGHSVTFFPLKNTAQYEVPASINLVFPLADHKGRLRGWFNRNKLARKLQASVADVENSSGAFDMVLVNLYESYRLASACNFKGCFYVIHNSYSQELAREKRMGPVKYQYMRRILTLLSGKDLVAVSAGVANELAQSTLFSPKSVSHIYNPFDIDFIQRQSKEAIPNTAPKKFILHVGRAARAKRHDVLFEAFKHVNPDYALVCLSSNNKKLKKLGQAYGIDERLHLPGFQANPYAWMHRAEIVVLSSDFEGLSMVLLEAILSGSKVVSTNCPYGPSEIMQGELAQFLVPTNNPKALAKAINTCIDYTLDPTTVPLLAEIDAKKIAAKYLSLLSTT